jgi:hypothetical protein
LIATELAIVSTWLWCERASEEESRIVVSGPDLTQGIPIAQGRHCRRVECRPERIS